MSKMGSRKPQPPGVYPSITLPKNDRGPQPYLNCADKAITRTPTTPNTASEPPVPANQGCNAKAHCILRSLLRDSLLTGNLNHRISDFWYR